MLTIGSFEAKTHLGQLLDKVAQGEKVTITKYGEPIAMLVPIKSSNKISKSEAIEKIKELKLSLKGLSIKDMIETGRRL